MKWILQGANLQGVLVQVSNKFDTQKNASLPFFLAIIGQPDDHIS